MLGLGWEEVIQATGAQLPREAGPRWLGQTQHLRRKFIIFHLELRRERGRESPGLRSQRVGQSFQDPSVSSPVSGVIESLVEGSPGHAKGSALGFAEPPRPLNSPACFLMKPLV